MHLYGQTSLDLSLYPCPIKISKYEDASVRYRAKGIPKNKLSIPSGAIFWESTAPSEFVMVPYSRRQSAPYTTLEIFFNWKSLNQICWL